MDVDALRAQLPTRETMLALDPIGQKRAIEDAVEMVLNAIGEDGRDPDPFESDHLIEAMSVVLSGHFNLAIPYLRYAAGGAAIREAGWVLQEHGPQTLDFMRSMLKALRETTLMPE